MKMEKLTVEQVLKQYRPVEDRPGYYWLDNINGKMVSERSIIKAYRLDTKLEGHKECPR